MFVPSIVMFENIKVRFQKIRQLIFLRRVTKDNENKYTCTLISSLGDKDRIFILRPSVHMVDEICAVMRIIYPLPTKRKFVICAVLRPLFLHPRKPGVQPMTRPRIMIDKVGLPFVRVSFFPVGRQGSQGVMGQGLPIGHGARRGLQPLVGVFGHIG